eukprot:scaffold247535_cov28-Tisochrysis_lutea.AAC.1
MGSSSGTTDSVWCVKSAILKRATTRGLASAACLRAMPLSSAASWLGGCGGNSGAAAWGGLA